MTKLWDDAASAAEIDAVYREYRAHVAAKLAANGESNPDEERIRHGVEAELCAALAIARRQLRLLGKSDCKGFRRAKPAQPVMEPKPTAPSILLSSEAERIGA